MLNIGLPNKIIGMSHGILFIIYVIIAIYLKEIKQWNLKKLGIILVCSIIPFGTFWMEKRFLKNVK